MIKPNAKNTERELNEIFDYLNGEFFNNELPKVPVEWNNRIYRTVGQFRYKRKKNVITPVKIELSKKVLSLNDEYILLEILLHEMAHIKVLGHGKDFKECVKPIEDDLGIKIGGATVNNKNFKGYWKYKYVCIDCFKEFKTGRELDQDRYTCKCGGFLHLEKVR